MTRNFRPVALDFGLASKYLKSVIKYDSVLQRFPYSKACEYVRTTPPRHLICFKQWTGQMVLNIVLSALNLKCRMRDTHNKRLDIIPNAKVMILQEVNEPMLTMAVSKAATLLGASDVGIIENMSWEQDYHGRIFSDMADIIFISTRTHMCVQRFANKSSVPVLCMKSRTHASLQSLATVMAIMEEFGTMQGINLSYVGPTHPVLNSYLLLCPMLGANIRFKCCCKKCPVTPLLFDASKAMCANTGTEARQCAETKDAIRNACVVVAGPTPKKAEKLPDFMLATTDINKETCFRWIFFHTCPRGEEVDDLLFWNENAKTFTAFQNMHYIAAALMAYHCRDYLF
uniref:ornithine carbamoyltransferase n=1 Tax=Spodoptera frugiperda TaxID=7108 RepID=A0A2H1WDI1_SPOFR